MSTKKLSIQALILALCSALYSTESAQAAGELQPTITSVSPQDGSILVFVQLAEGDVEGGNWFYQVRNFDINCNNPYGNETTWNTDGLVESFKVGRRTDLEAPIDGFDLRLPLTNDCAYTINVAHWNGDVGEYATTTATPRRVSPEERERRNMEINRSIALKTLRDSKSFDEISLEILRDAGIKSVPLEIMRLLQEFILALDVNQRVDGALIEAKSRELYIEYFFVQLARDIRNVSVDGLLSLGFEGLTETMIPEITSYLQKNNAIKNQDFTELQKIIDAVLTLQKGRQGKALSVNEWKTLGIVVDSKDFGKEVFFRLGRLSAEAFQDLSSIEQSVREIEARIADRRQKFLSAKAKTEKLREKVNARR